MNSIKGPVYSAVVGFFLLLSASASMAREAYNLYYSKIPAVRAESWDLSLLKRNIKDKIEPISQLAIDFNIALNQWDGFKQVPIPELLDAETRQLLLQELDKLPQSLKNFIDRHIIGIYTAQNVGGTGMAGNVFDDKNNCLFGFIILDLEMMSKPVNEWATFKENTVFAPEKNYQLEVQLENGPSNNKAATMRYLLMHEIGHVFHSVNKLQPPNTLLTWDDKDFDSYIFNRHELDRKKKMGDDYYPLLEKIRFYRPKPPFDIDEATDVYHWILSSSFSSLYGSVNYLEDFAETFSLLIHTRYLGRPFLVTLKKDGNKVITVGPRFNEPALANKANIIEAALKLYE